MRKEKMIEKKRKKRKKRGLGLSIV